MMGFWCKGKNDYCNDTSCEACNDCKHENGSGGIELEDDDVKDIVIRRWISVKDRLPEIGDSYLGVVKEKYPHEAKWNIHVDVAASHGKYIDDFWDTFNDWDEGNEVHVTHWMPLPEPPKEE